MKAAVLYGARDLRLEEVPAPIRKDNEVLVRILINGLCGSDIHFFMEGKLGPFVVDKPYIPGHEAVGEVVEGPRFSQGDLVVIEPGIPCGTCEFCRSGRYNLCPDVTFLSAPPINGTFAEYVAIDASMLHRLPEGVSLEAGALVEPLSVGMQACNRANLKPGCSIAIVGSGPIGLITMQVARTFGAVKVCMMDVFDSRLSKAIELGADEVINTRKTSEGEVIASLTHGRGVDVVFDTSGSNKGAASTVALAKRGGVIVLVGWPEVASFPFPMEMVIEKELDVRGVNRYCNTFTPVLSLLSSKAISVEGIISQRFPFDQVVEAFRFAAEHRGEVNKVLIG
ncbi:MAG TPA: alcohol dehydrogenase [Sphaerochaeta sp.]|nr:alcohol dehydrogenase [Sphaerochaeta sp.]